jgi:ParB family transcriptional regulator, chromosome partitioning protein
VGKQISRLSGHKARRLTTRKDGNPDESPEPPDVTTNRKDTDERYTPGWLIEKARLVLGDIDCDSASSDLANRTVRAKTYFAKEDDGLQQPWQGRVWCNYPWRGGFATWAAKFASEWAAGRMTAGCLLAPGEMAWRVGDLPSGGALWFPPNDQRPKFLDPVANRWVGTRYPCWLVYYGPEKRKFAAVFGEVGQVYLGLPSGAPRKETSKGRKPQETANWQNGNMGLPDCRFATS